MPTLMAWFLALFQVADNTSQTASVIIWVIRIPTVLGGAWLLRHLVKHEVKSGQPPPIPGTIAHTDHE